MPLSAGQILHATDLFDTFVGEVVNNSLNRTSTTTEVIGNTLTFTSPGTGARYDVFWTGSYVGSVVNDISRLRLRYQSGASVTTSGTQLRINTMNALVASKGEPFVLNATLSGLSAGSWTIGGTIQRVSGSGTNSVVGTATDEEFLKVLRIA